MTKKRFMLRWGIPLFAAAVLAAVPAVSAQAADTININPGNVPTTAAAKGGGCAEAGEVGANQDGWVFVLPRAMGKDAFFISVTAHFEDGSSFNTGAHGGVDSTKGTSKAWIITPAGLNLTGASAEVENLDPPKGQIGKESFNLTHACAGEPTEPTEPTEPEEQPTTPEEAKTTPEEEKTTPEEEMTTPEEEKTTPEEEKTTAEEEKKTEPPKEDETTKLPDELPVTGTGLGGLLAAAAGLIAAGLAMLYLMRRRGIAEE
jgi:hypothetical protein